MRLLFVILAHDRPAQVADLAHTLTSAATDGHAVVHFDAGASAADAAALARRLDAMPRARGVTAPVRCRWGDYGLVEAPLRALAEARDAGIAYDYAVLLSGACLPCRPLRQLERFLAAHRGREFVQAEDERWVLDGLRTERWQLYFFMPPSRRRWADRLSVRVQRALGVRRRFPPPLVPRLGSQWWGLTRTTCEAILDYAAAHPETMRFFRRTWIPDELVVQTLAHHLAGPEAIAGFNLTHYQFTDRGKPVVFHDDHADYVATLQRFFVRKAAPEAHRLRAACLARAAAPDDGAPLDRIGEPNDDYAVKVHAQTAQPRPGQIFYRDQFVDQTAPILARATAPYVVVVGPTPHATAVLAHLRPDRFEPLGAPFRRDAVDLGPERTRFHGLARADVALRDAHPALFLARLRARCAQVPALAWSPFDHQPLLREVIRDRAALVVACLPIDVRRDAAMVRLLEAETPGAAAALAVGHVAPPQWRAARAERRLSADLLDSLREPGDGPSSRLVPLYWGGEGEPAVAAADRALAAGLARSRFAAEPWFDALAADLGRAHPAVRGAARPTARRDEAAAS